ncbi:expressed unknown protein [Seminavis robusta]|uniref:Peptidase S1 domain-containing protein n=1 Tax=Seminavis robusta TaxID=568900 RepID=A0A9N8HQG9_9STRA|nr:expressed unknown protein [Seminavis robusta]|eukprot:Sro983_g227850.1 n/a (574) ;mRNA; f:36115-38054
MPFSCLLPTLLLFSSWVVPSHQHISGYVYHKPEEVRAFWTPERIAAASAIDDPELANATDAKSLRARRLNGAAVANAHWPENTAAEKKVAKAVGRLMAVTSDGRTGWCTASVIIDGKNDRSLLLTAAHCLCSEETKQVGTEIKKRKVWNKMFLFIPKIDDGDPNTDDSTDRDCSNDPLGCWIPTIPLVDMDFAKTFDPKDNPFDYGILVVNNNEEFQTKQSDGTDEMGPGDGAHILDLVVDPLEVDTSATPLPANNMALFVGNPSAHDAELRYCSNKAVKKQNADAGNLEQWFIEGCNVRGGASGGPGLSSAGGKIFSVNGFGNVYGPLLSGYFKCVLRAAKAVPLNRKDGVVVFGENCELGKKSGVFGDPHFEAWSGKRYDFMGACDLVFMRAPLFAPGLTLDIIVRTKIHASYSFVERAVVKIGENVLEVASYGEYFLDGVDSASMPNTIGGFEVTHHQISVNEHIFDIALGLGESILIRTIDQMVSIELDAADPLRFRESVGMLGDIKSGKLIARNGVTVLEDAEPNVIAAEWQVRDDEQMLFQTAEYPQYPEKCVYNVIATGDLEMASA